MLGVRVRVIDRDTVRIGLWYIGFRVGIRVVVV